MSKKNLTQPYKALVIGSGGAIGAAWLAAFNADPLCLQQASVSRSLGPAADGTIPCFDLADPLSIAAHAGRVREGGPYDIIVDATGALHIDGVGPEKSLSGLQHAHLLRAFEINTIGPALVLKHFAPLLAPGRSLYAKLSARVGSIGDNRKGGWYGYRASKAAMNMLLQTAALELQRKQPQLMLVALQPGTVNSRLSAPFQANVEHLLEPEQSVAGMLSALQRLEPVSGAQFIDYQGQPIPW